MKKSEDTLNESIRVLKTSTCKTLSGKSTLTYQVGVTPDEIIHLRITKNTGAGFFSNEWISFEDIYRTLEKRPEGSPVLSHFITPLLKGKSVNTSAFLLAALSHLRLLTPVKGKKRQHELLNPESFLDRVNALSSTSKKAPVKKTTKKTATKKAAIKKRATSKRKKASAQS